MDPENQALIKRIVDEHGDADIVVMLGAADAEAVEVAAETVRDGDPAWVGPLAGVQLGLPVLHIFEDDVKEQADAEVYEAQIGFFEMTLDVDGVKEAMRACPRRVLSTPHARSRWISRTETRCSRAEIFRRSPETCSIPEALCWDPIDGARVLRRRGRADLLGDARRITRAKSRTPAAVSWAWRSTPRPRLRVRLARQEVVARRSGTRARSRPTRQARPARRSTNRTPRCSPSTGSCT